MYQECPSCKKGILEIEKTNGNFQVDGEEWSEHIERHCDTCGYYDDYYQ
mgnify:CR=1 FL=1